jgi:hypothetical protein
MTLAEIEAVAEAMWWNQDSPHIYPSLTPWRELPDERKEYYRRLAAVAVTTLEQLRAT